jgi:hypothetical protein
MPATARGSRYRIAFGKQTAEGTALAIPAYETNLYDGNLIPTNVESMFDVADTEDIPIGYWIEGVGATGDPVVSSDSDSAGFWWALHLGSDTVTSPAPPPKLHTIIRSYTKSFATVYHMRPGTAGGTDLWNRSVDTFIQAVEVRAAKGLPIQHAITLLAKKMEMNVTAPVPANDKRILGANNTNLFSLIGGTIKLDLGATPSTTQVHITDNITVRSEYPNAQWVQTDDIFGYYFDLGEWNLAVTADIVVQDYNAFASTFWGSATVPGVATPGAALSNVVVNGAFDFLFQTAPTSSVNRTFELQGPSIRWRMAPPTMDKTGAAQKATLTGSVFKPASGEPFTVLVGNNTASY